MERTGIVPGDLRIEVIIVDVGFPLSDVGVKPDIVADSEAVPLTVLFDLFYIVGILRYDIQILLGTVL